MCLLHNFSKVFCNISFTLCLIILQQSQIANSSLNHFLSHQSFSKWFGSSETFCLHTGRTSQSTKWTAFMTQHLMKALEGRLVCLHVYVCVSAAVFVCLFVCLSVSVIVSVAMFVCLQVCLFMCLSVDVSICLQLCLSVCRYVCLCVCLQMYLSVCSCVCLFVCL